MHPRCTCYLSMHAHINTQTHGRSSHPACMHVHPERSGGALEGNRSHEGGTRGEGTGAGPFPQRSTASSRADGPSVSLREAGMDGAAEADRPHFLLAMRLFLVASMS